MRSSSKVWRRFWWVLVVAACWQSGLAGATTWIVPSEAEMLASADAVVLATVERLRSIESLDGSRIDTEVTLRVHEAYKGAVAGDRVVLEEVGGHVGVDTQWAFGSPEYRVGETVLAYVKRSRDGRLRTQHMAIGKVDAEVRSDGQIILSRVKPGGGRLRQPLASFERTARRSVGGLRGGAARIAGLGAPRSALEGIAQEQTQFRLMQPGSRWFTGPVQLFGDLAGEVKLGKDVANRVVQTGGAAWSGQPGSYLETQYGGEKRATGFTCNQGFVAVSFGDPLEQITDPGSCGGGVLAVGGFCASGSPLSGTPYHSISGGAVVFNDGWQGCWFWNETNLREVMTHELGHALGFAHSWESSLGSTNDPFVTDATMYWMAHFDGRGAKLKDYDKGVLAYLYEGESSGPAPTPRTTPAPTPAPTSEPTPAPTPTDAGNPDDPDGDGVVDADDNCPTRPNASQSDQDEDGVGDACDSCAELANPDQAETCVDLAGGADIAVGRTGDARLNVRVHFAPWLGEVSGLTLDVAGRNATYTFRLPVRRMEINKAGTTVRYRSKSVSLTLRKFRNGRTHIALLVTDPAMATLVGEDLSVKVRAPAYEAAADMACKTTKPGRYQRVTRCSVEQADAGE